MLEFPSDEERSSEICCNEEALKSCKSVNIRAEDFLKDEISFHGVVLQFSNEIGHGRDYKNAKGDEASSATTRPMATSLPTLTLMTDGSSP